LSNVSEQLTGLIETNAPIQPGDSGGPLVNSYGQVIGMDTAASSNYQFQGQSSTATQAYAIPINEAVSIAKQIEASTTSADVHIGATAFLGLQIAGQNSGGFGGFGGQNGASGVTVAGTVSGSPAAKAGLVQGDVITAIDGQSVSTAEDIPHALVKHHPGDSISITWLDQSGQSHTATVTLATGPAA
jgi:S1-C subfamily serine protease